MRRLAALQDDYVLEMVRFGASELHLVAALMGGMAAQVGCCNWLPEVAPVPTLPACGMQETIKLITGQFTPTPGTLMYNAMASTTLVLDL